MNDNAYQRIAPASSSPALSAVLVEPPSSSSLAAAARRRTYSKSKYLFWKLWRRTWKPTINIDKLVRMRLRWRTVAKILGGILFFKISLSILGALVGSDPSSDYMVMPNDGSVRDVFGNVSDYPAVNTTPAPPPPPPPIPPPMEAIRCENLGDYAGMVGTAPEVDTWQTIQLAISFGFSAFFDDRLDGVASIKVMALADEWLDAREPMCQLWFNDRVEPFALPANVTNFPAQQTARYKSVMYTCTYTIVQPDMPAPIAVSMSSEGCGKPLNMFKLNYLDKGNPIENREKFTVCLASPMRLNFSEPGEMVDWIEVHKIFGVTKYVMYEHDIADNMRPFMDHYVQNGVMDVIKWKLPAEIHDPREGVKAFGQLSLINDCLYRNMYKSKYIVYLDLDEMMVPRGISKTLEEVLVTTSCQDKAQTIIRSAFFRKQWTNDEKYASDERMVKRSLVSLLKTKRERKVLAINVHAKFIVIPEMIDALETLAALRFLATVGNNTGEATCVLLAKECLLHHYRYYEEFTGDWMIDRKLHEFTKLIVERTGAVHEVVNAAITANVEAAAAEAAAAEQAAEEVVAVAAEAAAAAEAEALVATSPPVAIPPADTMQAVDGAIPPVDDTIPADNTVDAVAEPSQSTPQPEADVAAPVQGVDSAPAVFQDQTPAPAPSPAPVAEAAATPPGAVVLAQQSDEIPGNLQDVAAADVPPPDDPLAGLPAQSPTPPPADENAPL